MTLTSAQLPTMHDTIYFSYPNLMFKNKCHLALSYSSPCKAEFLGPMGIEPCCKDTCATHKHSGLPQTVHLYAGQTRLIHTKYYREICQRVFLSLFQHLPFSD